MTGWENQVTTALAEHAAQVPDEAAQRVARHVRTQLAVKRSRRLTMTGIAAAVSVLGIGAGIVFSQGTGTGMHEGPGVFAHPTRQAVIQLDGLRLTLPPGFSPTSAACLPPATTPSVPIEPTMSATAPQGGCLAAALVPDQPLPQGLRQVDINGHPGWLSTDAAANTVSLFVVVPNASEHPMLDLTGKGVPASTLVTIAKASLPF